MVFPSEHFGYSLAGFLEAIKPHEDKPIFLVIQDNQGDIFGVFFLQKLTSNIDVNYTSTSDTFVFTLEPEACEYTSTGYNTQYCQIEESFICFGNGKYPQTNLGLAPPCRSTKSCGRATATTAKPSTVRDCTGVLRASLRCRCCNVMFCSDVCIDIMLFGRVGDEGEGKGGGGGGGGGGRGRG